MKQILNFTAVLMILAITGCQKEVQQEIEENTSESALTNARTPGNASINLSVKFEDEVVINGVSTPTEIRSDDGTAYEHGKKQVEAQILSSDGNFYLNTNSNTAKPTLRWLQFQNPANYPVTVTAMPNYSLRTTIGDTWLQNMGEGDANSKLVGFRIWGLKQKGVLDWRLVWRNGYESAAWDENSATDYAKVTRTKPGEWTIEPACYIGVTPANAALYPGVANSNEDRMGYRVVPFKLTLTKIVK